MPLKAELDWYDMDESLYRASRICRVLGNPKAYQILAELRTLGAATPTELAPRINRTMASTCITLKSLREVDLVRYQRNGKNVVYRVKDSQVEKTLDALGTLVAHIRRESR